MTDVSSGFVFSRSGSWGSLSKEVVEEELSGKVVVNKKHWILEGKRRVPRAGGLNKSRKPVAVEKGDKGSSEVG